MGTRCAFERTFRSSDSRGNTGLFRAVLTPTRLRVARGLGGSCGSPGGTRRLQEGQELTMPSLTGNAGLRGTNEDDLFWRFGGADRGNGRRSTLRRCPMPPNSREEAVSLKGWPCRAKGRPGKVGRQQRAKAGTGAGRRLLAAGPESGPLSKGGGQSCSVRPPAGDSHGRSRWRC